MKSPFWSRNSTKHREISNRFCVWKMSIRSPYSLEIWQDYIGSILLKKIRFVQNHAYVLHKVRNLPSVSVANLGCIHLLNTHKYCDNTRQYYGNTHKYWVNTWKMWSLAIAIHIHEYCQNTCKFWSNFVEVKTNSSRG